MAKNIMIQGTMSNAGKSLLCAGLCRVLKQDGYRVAPFKSQNMALNSFITESGGEMGRAQVVQAEAAGIAPDVRMNPILLKPTTDVGSQVIVNGQVRGNMRAMEYYRRKREFVPEVMKAYDSLASEYDVIVIEGAGSPAEINLKQEDIVNMGLAKMVDAPVLLVGDIDRGGVFAQLYGTVALLEEDERARIKGTVINKFRGDKAILEPGLKTLEELCGVPVAGVIPYVHVDIDDEDSLSERFQRDTQRKLLDIAVIRLPRISNFTDFAPFERYGNVSVRYVASVEDLHDPDMILLPGTKSTISDLLWLRQCGLEAAISKAASAGTLVMGICGGYQMLGTSVSDPDQVEAAGITEIAGLGLIDMDTVFRGDKVQTQTRGTFTGVTGMLKALNGLSYEGYEIHMGRSQEALPALNGTGNIYGSYIHGIFDAPRIADTILKAVCTQKGLDVSALETYDATEYKQRQYDILAGAVRQGLDMDLIYRILNREV
ncbi:MAG: cobyric acid synthase [Clostridiales bacterium]|nr:cobyric acid synthase [Clostridiales bacterium]